MTRGQALGWFEVVWDGAADIYQTGEKGQLTPPYDSHTNPLFEERDRIKNPQAKSKLKGLVRCSVCRRLAMHRGKCAVCRRTGRTR